MAHTSADRGDVPVAQSEYYAHSDPARPRSEWHRLEGHLRAAADLAEQFASTFASGDWARLAGLWHDLGKYREEFQTYLEQGGERLDHAVVGSLLAQQKHGQMGMPLALAIAGHHGGLPNLQHQQDTDATPLLARVKRNAPLLGQIRSALPGDFVERSLPEWPGHLSPGPGDRDSDQAALTRSTEFWVRFLFSALVDADFLDTEAFFEPGRRAAAKGFDSIAALLRRLDAHLDGLTGDAEPTDVNRVRAEVLSACRRAAGCSPGNFSLSVPTGGGKTLSAMAFALRHAERHGLRRVIVVIPYTSIIEQNAAVYREVLGESNVIEHHSNVDPREETVRNRLASENWDAPVIVTTSVQFFESLFASKPSRCRKLHNVAGSVIVLDEVQTLPPAFLLAILDGLNELAGQYGCSVVLSTATQPALTQRQTLPLGLTQVRSIIDRPATMSKRLKRVHIEWPDPDAPPVEWEDVAQELAAHERVLAIVHRRADARDLARQLPDDGLFHLSALMCPAHRAKVFGQVREALLNDRLCRLVSTQLVEAGVDVDFPLVYRALGGLDSVVQGAGRCNREGKLDMGQVVVFRAPTSPPRGTATKGLDTTVSLLRQHCGEIDIEDSAVFETYFRILYSKEDLDAKQIQTERQRFNFATVAKSFRLIEDGFSHPVVVPFGDVEDRLDALRKHGPSRENLRALQPFLVNVYEPDVVHLTKSGAFEIIGDVVYALAAPFHRLYSERFGLVLDETPQADPASLVV